MFNPHAEPIEHRPPYKRIGINEPWVTRSGTVHMPTTAEICEAEQDRIWASIKAAAEGTNIRSARQISEEAIEIIDRALERIDCGDCA